MSTDQETTRIVRSWLEDGVTHLPEGVLGTVLAELPTTPQRRATPWPARRTPTMNKIVGLGLAAAAVVVAVFIGIQLFGSPDGVGAYRTPTATLEPTVAPTPRPSPTASTGPTASPSPTAPPSPSPTAGPSDEAAALVRTFNIGSVVIRVTRPTTWRVTDDTTALGQLERRGPEPYKPTLFVTEVNRLNLTPCGSPVGSSSIGGTAEDLANALASLPGLTAEGPTELVVGGYTAFEVTLVSPAASADCSRWTLWGGENEHWLAPNERNRLWIVDVDGNRVVISAEIFADSPPEAFAEQTEMVESIELFP